MQTHRSDLDPEPPLPLGPALTRFGLGLYRELTAGRDDNLVCSPFSVAAVLGMLLPGARGETAAQLRTVLGVEQPDSLARFDRALAGRGEPPDRPDGEDETVRIAVANRLWAQGGLRWSGAYLDALESQFGAAPAMADFRAGPDRARQEINAWVAGRTEQRIADLLGPGSVDAATRLVLVNAIHLKSPWLNPFQPEYSHPLPFHRLDGSSPEVTFMHGATFGYATGPGWAATELACQGDLSVLVLLPDPGRFAELEAAVDEAWLAALEFRSAAVELRIPRWTTRTAADLVPALTALGLRLTFSDAADFSGMADDPLFASAAVQQAFIAVDERGVEAAASTALLVAACGASPPEQVRFTADRPFLYLVRDTGTGVPLFVGRVTDPTDETWSR